MSAVTAAIIDAWIATAPGRAMNPDQKYGLQCKDVIDDYCTVLFGNWINTIRPGDAKDCFDGSNPDYFVKVRNDPNQIPPRGAIICWDGNMGGGLGHIAVVESSNPSVFNVIEQDGFKQIPAYRNHYMSYRYVIGWLIPKVGDELSKITKEQEDVLSIGTTGSVPGKDYNYRFSGLDTTQENVDALVNFWKSQSIIPALQAAKPVDINSFSTGDLLRAAINKIFGR